MRKKRKWLIASVSAASILIILWLETNLFWLNKVGNIESGILLCAEDTCVYHPTDKKMSEEIALMELEGETVNLNLHKEFMGQFQIIFFVLASIPLLGIVGRAIWRKICDLQKGEKQRIVECVWFLVLFYSFLLLILNSIQFSRIFLPQETIFDLRFYVKSIKDFFQNANPVLDENEMYLKLKETYQLGLRIYGVFVFGVWMITIGLARMYHEIQHEKHCRNLQKKQM